LGSLLYRFGGVVSGEAEEGFDEGPSADGTGYPSIEPLMDSKEPGFGFEEEQFKGPGISTRDLCTSLVSKLMLDGCSLTEES
jgi:hypothetical protein